MTDIVLVIITLWGIGMVPALVIFVAMEVSIKYSDGFLPEELLLRAVLWPIIICVGIYEWMRG